MKDLEKYFPFGKNIEKDNAMSLAIAIVIYVILSGVAGLILGFLSQIKLVGWVFSIFGSIVGLYALVGIILAIVKYVNMSK